MPTETSDALHVTRADVLGFRLSRSGLDGTDGGRTDLDLLDGGVPDSGPDGARWALHLRGVEVEATDLVVAWTLRGAPHAYRRSDVAAIATATAPYDEADAAKRVFDASKPLREAGIAVLDALRTVALAMQRIVTGPMPKGELSTRLTAELPEPFHRWCRPCATTHLYEQTFRLAALQAGLELVPGTSPPVLTPIQGFEAPAYAHLAGDADDRFDAVAGALRRGGPARVKDVATVLDAPVRVVRGRLPDDVVDVVVDDEEDAARAAPRTLAAADAVDLMSGRDRLATGTRLLGPFDPHLQQRDRALLVPDEVRRAELWPVLGRPGAVLHDGELVGSWRPRTKSGRLTVVVEPWRPLATATRRAVEAQAEILATHRDVPLTGVEWPPDPM